ncbi:MAG: DMT family transporter [Chloroflexota bacterium]
MPKIPVITALVAALLFGAATPASKALLNTIPPFQLAGLLYIGAAIGVTPLILRQGKLVIPWHLSKVNLSRLIGSIFFGGILGPVFLLFGLQSASSASVSMWLNLELIFTALLGYFLFKDHLTVYAWLATACMLFAAVLLANSEGTAGITAGLFVALACLSWGLDNHLTVLIEDISPAQTTFWKGVVAGSINFAIGTSANPHSTGFNLIGMAILVGVFAYGFSIVLYIISAQKLGATRGQTIFSTAPFFGVLLSAILLGEPIVSGQIWAGLIIIFSLAFLFLERHEHNHAHEKMLHTHPHWPDQHHRHVHKK